MLQTVQPPAATPTPNQPEHSAPIAWHDPSQLATAAGLATLVVGSGLFFAPRRSAALLGLGLDDRAARLLGAADLATVPGLLAGRRRYPWMFARTAMNAVIAGLYRRAVARPGGGTATARGGLATMLALTVLDGAVALSLARRERAMG